MDAISRQTETSTPLRAQPVNIDIICVASAADLTKERWFQSHKSQGGQKRPKATKTQSLDGSLFADPLFYFILIFLKPSELREGRLWELESFRKPEYLESPVILISFSKSRSSFISFSDPWPIPIRRVFVTAISSHKTYSSIQIPEYRSSTNSAVRRFLSKTGQTSHTFVPIPTVPRADFRSQKLTLPKNGNSVSCLSS